LNRYSLSRSEESEFYTGNGQSNLAGTISHATAPVSTYSADPESELQKEKSLPILPQKSTDGRILVDWYTTDDDKNPQNWSLRKKVFVSFLIWSVPPLEIVMSGAYNL
jgi:hypothetical protein